MSLPKPCRAILIDLFWTAVDMDFTHYPKLISPFPGDDAKELTSDADVLYGAVKAHGVSLGRDKFLSAYFASRKKVTEEWEKGVMEEVSSVEKFARLLQSFEVFAANREKDLMNLAQNLTEIHMEHIVRATVISERRRDVLADLSQSHSLALVSNFDHAPSGYEILLRHGIEGFFAKIIISDEWGKRKPHPVLFEKAMESLGVVPEETLMVGDSPLADIEGARKLGIEAIWVQRPGEEWPKDLAPPTYRIGDLSEIHSLQIL